MVCSLLGEDLSHATVAFLPPLVFAASAKSQFRLAALERTCQHLSEPVVTLPQGDLPEFRRVRS
jgi:hypothetical protein